MLTVERKHRNNIFQKIKYWKDSYGLNIPYELAEDFGKNRDDYIKALRLNPELLKIILNNIIETE